MVLTGLPLWAHPRSRGEHGLYIIRGIVSPGSYPLTRGALLVALELRAVFRLIPAHAGSTFRADIKDSSSGAHPRSRGEHTRAITVPAGATGSSPLTRGAQVDDAPDTSDEGLIPAHAGSTPAFLVLVVLLRAHPRSRGEHWCRLVSRHSLVGSSPLTRGAPQVTQGLSGLVGLIPAHAGSTGYG